MKLYWQSYRRSFARLLILFGIVIVGIVIVGTAFGSASATQTQSSKRARTRAVAADALSAPVKTFGSPTAPITMEVFSDYECPSCRAFFEQTLRPMMNDYVAAGKVYLVQRDFPLPMHPYSHQAARWANAAAEIGKFEEVDSALFDNQNAWSADGNMVKYVAGAMSAADFKRVEKIMQGCEPQATSGCAVDAWISSDVALGNQVPVRATPTYVISYKGRRLDPGSGVVSWPLLKQFFNSLMAQ